VIGADLASKIMIMESPVKIVAHYVKFEGVLVNKHIVLAKGLGFYCQYLLKEESFGAQSGYYWFMY